MLSFAQSLHVKNILGTKSIRYLMKQHTKLSSGNSNIYIAREEINVLVPVANGTEEIEAVTIIDTLVRSGAKVTVASVSSDKNVICSRGVKLQADVLIGECLSNNWDIIVCPGGMPGAEHLRDSKELTDLLNTQALQNKYIAAICASPAIVLATHNLLGNKSATCYPASKFITAIEKKAKYSMEKVVVDGNIITSQGPGTSLLFSLKLVELLYGPEQALLLSKEMIQN